MASQSLPKVCQKSIPSSSDRRTRILWQDHLQPYLTAFAEHQRNRGLSENTISVSASDLQIFYKAVQKNLARVTRQDVVRTLSRWQSEGISDSTVCRRGSVLRSFYDFLFLRGLIQLRPTSNVPLPKPWVRVVRVPNLGDLERIIAAVSGQSPQDLRSKIILLLLRDTGIRETALSQLGIDDFDWENRWISVRQDKFGKQHPVPASKRVFTALRDYIDNGRPYFLRGRDLRYLFPGVNYLRVFGRKHVQGGDHIARQRVWQIVTWWSKRVLGHSISPHHWRAACLTEADASGMDIFDLMCLAGHSSPEVTNRYIRHNLGHLKDKFYATHPRAGRRP